MAVYHIILFKLKPNINPSTLSELKMAVLDMVGKVPGLQRVDIGPPHSITAHRALGFDMALVAVLDKPETIKAYAEHPEHLKVHKLRAGLCTETLAYDLEFAQ
ncbi:uncharacterized protein PAC_10063 [Phialocephala subalpina]|uniref:Stress-response A/B barrel domain-containing protein n=1 Tax=Phialocephala subalpina TaxID=576137 RepID=A0A1L7X594_9HELO|nr:uncharacterized protein PAC_10063 [Phialocephala subalpina]